MRLTSQQSNAIIQAITPFLKGLHAELRLHGSRVNDHLKGGDIDLLLLLEDEHLLATLIENKHYLLAAIKKELGDQKIDLVLATHHMIEQDVFLTLVFPDSLLLKKW